MRTVILIPALTIDLRARREPSFSLSLLALSPLAAAVLAVLYLSFNVHGEYEWD